MALLWKMICNLKDPMSLRHPVQETSSGFGLFQKSHIYRALQEIPIYRAFPNKLCLWGSFALCVGLVCPVYRHFQKGLFVEPYFLGFFASETWWLRMTCVATTQPCVVAEVEDPTHRSLFLGLFCERDLMATGDSPVLWPRSVETPAYRCAFLGPFCTRDLMATGGVCGHNTALCCGRGGGGAS